jgi:hypothetical protein
VRRMEDKIKLFPLPQPNISVEPPQSQCKANGLHPLISLVHMCQSGGYLLSKIKYT